MKQILGNLQQELLVNIDEAKAAEFYILESFGENNVTLTALDELTAIAQQSSDLYIQITRLLLQISEI